MSRTLATIQTIKSFEPIEGRDRIVLASFENIGWHCITDKSFKVGERVVYIEPDSILPEKPVFEDLRSRCWNKTYNGFRIRSMKMANVISEGIVFHTSSVLREDFNPAMVDDGYDVTEAIGIIKYDPEALEEQKLIENKSKKYGPVMLFLIRIPFLKKLLLPKRKKPGKWPDFIAKTDETRVQSLNYVFEKYQGLPIYVSVKKDGQSATFFYNKKEFGVCSRNLRLSEPKKLKGKYVGEQSKYWQTAEKYKVKEKLMRASKELGINLYIQGEQCGPSIQGNKYGYNELKLFIFNVYDITHKRYYGYYELLSFCKKYGFETVHMIEERNFDWKNTDELVEYAKGYDPDGDKVLREGVVIRSIESMPPDKCMANMWSLKAINHDFAVKWGSNDYSEKK
jgi:hypothetical protein